MTPMYNSLLAEIGFWKRLIASRQDSASTVTLERMEQALELAEFRLGEIVSQPDNKHVCH